MGKKKGFKGGNAQQALQNQVTRMQIKALEPYVQQQVQIAASQIQQTLARQQLSYVADSTLRIGVLEDIVCDKLGYTKESLAELTLTREDKAMDLVKVDREAQKGDFLRVEFFAKQTETPEGQDPPEYKKEGQIFFVKDLLQEGSKAIHDQVVLSEALLGMKVGEEKEEILEEHKVSVKLKISRISEKLKLEETNA